MVDGNNTFKDGHKDLRFQIFKEVLIPVKWSYGGCRK